MVEFEQAIPMQGCGVRSGPLRSRPGVLGKAARASQCPDGPETVFFPPLFVLLEPLIVIHES